MSETQSQLLNQKITRRDFLKYTGISAIGATTMSWLLPGCASKDIKVFETADGMIIHESARCTGCLVCEATCSVGNDGKASQVTARIKVSQNYAYGPKGVRGDWVNGPGEMGNFTLVADTCRQCEQPACALACPENAIFEHEGTGAREVDPENASAAEPAFEPVPGAFLPLIRKPMFPPSVSFATAIQPALRTVPPVHCSMCPGKTRFRSTKSIFRYKQQE